MTEPIFAQFGRFTESEYHKTLEEIITDLKDDEKALEKIYAVLNKWITWLGQDHPEIITCLCRYKNTKKTFKAILTRSRILTMYEKLSIINKEHPDV